jgi:ABC-type sugar transport system ATPase subunit
MVEIARALAGRPSVLIMDEPTSALSDAEVERLFRVIRDLRDAGTAVLYISHKMNEVFALADRVTVLRDGRLVDSAPRYALAPADVVRSMVGREIAQLRLEPANPTPTPLLEIAHLDLPRPPRSSRPALQDISFTLHEGEVLGVAGLLGAGRTELLEALFGASHQPPTGTVRLAGRPHAPRSPREALAAGVALVTEDRKLLGLFPRLPVRANISLGCLSKLARTLGFVDRPDERATVTRSIDALGIRAASQELPITALSGGNQQKCVLARALLAEPRVLLLDEPTRGIDVGAKADLYALMRKLAAQGLGILVTSSELPELLAVCDRILVLCEGRLTADLPRADASEEAIMHHATAFLDRAPAPVP